MIHHRELHTTILELERNNSHRAGIPTNSTPEYDKLLEASDLNSKQDAYLEWLLVDSAYREPRTETELARLLDVNIPTFMRWKESPEFVRQFKGRLRTKYIYELPEIFSALISRAKNGDVPAIRFCLQLFGMIPGPELKMEASSVSLAEAVRAASEDWPSPTWASEQEQSAASAGLKMELPSP